MTSYRLVYGYQHFGGHIRDPTVSYTVCPTNDYSTFQLSTHKLSTFTVIQSEQEVPVRLLEVGYSLQWEVTVNAQYL